MINSVSIKLFVIYSAIVKLLNYSITMHTYIYKTIFISQQVQLTYIFLSILNIQLLYKISFDFYVFVSENWQNPPLF